MVDNTHPFRAASTEMISPGLRVATAEAMRDRETFTKAQVTLLIALAFESGIAWAHNADVAEVWVGFRDHPLERKTAQERYRERLASMEDAYNRQRERDAAHSGIPDDPGSWPTVAVVGPGVPS